MNPANARMTTECLTASFWERAWQKFQQDSILKTTQQMHPDRWRRFYDETAELWDQITGHGPDAAEAALQAMVDARHQLGPDMTALEIGCGPGNLAMALAARGVKVTAMDDSAGMTSVLRGRMQSRGINNVEIIEAKWEDVSPAAGHDLVMAAFFPQAMTPAGIERMESGARQTCALVVGAGQEAFPLRREIWRKIMPDPLPEINFHLPCAMAYLLTSGRNPNLRHFNWQASLCMPSNAVVSHFQAYLAIFGKEGPDVRKAIVEVVSTHSDEGVLRMEAEASAALIHWHPLHARP